MAKNGSRAGGESVVGTGGAKPSNAMATAQHAKKRVVYRRKRGSAEGVLMKACICSGGDKRAKRRLPPSLRIDPKRRPIARKPE
jgi:hypothetical protein